MIKLSIVHMSEATRQQETPQAFVGMKKEKS